MKPKKPAPDQDDLLRARLVEMFDMRHELVTCIAQVISRFSRQVLKNIFKSIC